MHFNSGEEQRTETVLAVIPNFIGQVPSRKRIGTELNWLKGDEAALSLRYRSSLWSSGCQNLEGSYKSNKKKFM